MSKTGFTEHLHEAIEEQRSLRDAEEHINDKILFTGLDNGGKTTIIKILEKEYSQISMLKPTRKAQRKIFDYLGQNIAEWDLGGQKRYRIAYLKEPTKFFDNTSVCIYTIDIQDDTRYEEAISYFDDVIEIFNDLKITPVIYIFFHKVDPDFEKENSVIVNGRISELKEEIVKICDNNYEIQFMKTTIFDLWSIISAFSQILLKLYPQSDLLDKTIADFSNLMEVQAVIILDENSLVIGQEFKNEEAKSVLASSSPYFLTLADTLDRKASGDNAMVVERGEFLFYIDQFTLDRTRGMLYLLMMKERSEDRTFSKEKIQSFLKILKSIL